MNWEGMMNSWIGFAFALFVLVLIIIWILLPFAVSSIQRSTRESLAVNRLILSELKKLNAEVGQVTTPVPEMGAPSPPDVSDDQPITQECPNCGFNNNIEVLECVKCGKRLPMP